MDFLGSLVPSVKSRQKQLCKVGLHKQSSVKRPYYTDSEGFGARMLANLGWTEGKGLGKDLQGDTVPISEKVKNDTDGLGYVRGGDDTWTQHEAGFSDLLRRLNGEENEASNGQNDDAIDPKTQLQSLEERSKKSRARVHYTKFTRGKDLSRANEKDLANIFGKRSLAEINVPVVEKVEESSESEDDSERPVLGLSIIKSSVSVHDYFREKMKQKAMGNGLCTNGTNGESAMEEKAKTNDDFGREKTDTEEHPPSDSGTSKKKKSKNKSKEVEESQQVEKTIEEHAETNGKRADFEEEPLSESGKKKMKKNKNKSGQIDEPMEVNKEVKETIKEQTEANGDCSRDHAETQEQPPSESGKTKKKKSKKKSEEIEETVDPVVESEQVVEPPSTKKSKRNREPLEQNEEETATADTAEPESELSSKKKKKSKKHKLEPEPALETTSEVSKAEPEPIVEGAVTAEEPVKKKKKSKTAKPEVCTEEDLEMAAQGPNTADAIEEAKNETDPSEPAKKKKKKEAKVSVEEEDSETPQPVMNGSTALEELNGKDNDGTMDESVLQAAAASVLSAEYREEEEETTCKVKVEVLKYLDEARFVGSNFGDIIGYRLTEEVKLVEATPNPRRKHAPPGGSGYYKRGKK